MAGHPAWRALSGTPRADRREPLIVSQPQRPLRPPFFGPSRRRPPDAIDGLTRELRDEYAAPDEARYWDSLETRILAAVRDGAARATATTTGAFRAVPAVAVEWWHALARWAEPGLALAGVALVIAAAVFVDARATVDASRAHSAFRDVLEAPISGPAVDGSVLDAGLARAGDDAVSDDPTDQARARRARIADELLSGGLARRRPSPGDQAVERARERAVDPTAMERARRDATFRELLPED